MDALEYIIEVTVCSGLFLALYRWLISGKTGYRICRMYILTAMTASAVIPALDIPVYSPDTESPALVAALEVHMHNRAAGLPPPMSSCPKLKKPVPAHHGKTVQYRLS